MGFWENLFGKEDKTAFKDQPVNTELMLRISSYVQENYDADAGLESNFASQPRRSSERPAGLGNITASDVDKMMYGYAKGSSSFADSLCRIMDQKNMTHLSAYRRSNVTKKDFYVLISNEHHKPEKNVAIGLCIGLELSRGQADSLLKKAGYALSKGCVTDLVAMYCLEHRVYNISEINRILYERKEPLLGSSSME